MDLIQKKSILIICPYPKDCAAGQRLKYEQYINRWEKQGYIVKISKSARNFIADKGFDSKFGARPLKRAIQKYFEDPLSEEIIHAKVKEGDIINVDLCKDKILLNMKISQVKSKKKTAKK